MDMLIFYALYFGINITQHINWKKCRVLRLRAQKFFLISKGIYLQLIWKSVNTASLSHRYVKLFTGSQKSFTLCTIQNRRGLRKKLITPEVIENILIIKVYLYTIHYVLTENFYDSFYTKICNYKLKVVRVYTTACPKSIGTVF